jgi:hypothetical protein
VLSGSLPVKDINVLLRGVGKDAPITVNATGGKQSATHYFFRGLPPLALVAVAKIMEEAAAKYEAPDNVYADPTDRNWHKIEDWEHIEHAFMHLVADLAGDTQDEHLEHALTRLMMAVHQRHAKKGAP